MAAPSLLRDVHFQEPLRYRPAPFPGETFPSYMRRVAAAHRLPLGMILDSTGIRTGTKVESGYGVTLSDVAMRRLCGSLRLSEETVRALLLPSLHGTSADLSGALGEPTGLRTVAQREWVSVNGSSACPACLADTHGAWLLAWKLPWKFACTRHRRLLASWCPSCERRLDTGRRDRSLRPLFLGFVPGPSHCMNPVAEGQASRGNGQPCGHDLTLIETLDLDPWPGILRAQETIDTVLRERTATAYGDAVTSLEYFDDLRVLVALALFGLHLEDFGELPSGVRQVLADEFSRRDAGVEERKGRGVRGRGAKSHVLAATPTDPRLMAAVVPLGVRIMSAGSPVALAEKLEVLTERAYERSRRRQLQRLLAYPRMSGTLRDALRDAAYHSSQFAVRLTARDTAGALSDYSYAAAHVPQMIDIDAYETSFRDLLPRVGADYVRRACSVMLVRLIEPECTWEACAEALDLPAKVASGTVNHVITQLNRLGNSATFNDRVTALAAELDGREAKKDYGRLRRALADYKGIPRTDWLAICRSVGDSQPSRGAKNQMAAVWVWCSVTGGEARFSPWFIRRRGTRKMDTFYGFRTRTLLRLREELAGYAARLEYSILSK